MEIYYSPELNKGFNDMYDVCQKFRHEFVMPEHLLVAFVSQKPFVEALEHCGSSADSLYGQLNRYLDSVERVPDDIKYEPNLSVQIREVLTSACGVLENAGIQIMKVPHVVKSMMELEESYAACLLKESMRDEGEFLSSLIMGYSDSDKTTSASPKGSKHAEQQPQTSDVEQQPQTSDAEQWRSLVTCVNDNVEKRNPLIGRERELERTIQVLCRKEKNNPLHVGDPGVGKTALVYGLAQWINIGCVPDRLRGCHIYQLDIGTLLAGTQYRGDFEKRLKMVMDGVSREEGVIVYIDEIHSIVGAGATGGGAMDASNMLKPYLEGGNIRFIGSTTHEEYNRHFSRSKSLLRRFQQIDIAEPSVEETINIVKQLKKNYERFHNVHYADSAIDFAVRASAQHINDRFLPDKAIDLIDEAGAYREIHPLRGQKRQTVDKTLISEILSKVCKVDALAMKSDDSTSLETLGQRIAAKIYGQDEAISKVTEAVQMAKAGLSDESKPLASLLFVGPTGVGKTEVARVLAAEMGIELVRFDMSEYTEKHTVAKLIGSPAGYVGYEDGGLLTDAIRRTPNCVLLLDEIEKAHQDIYNILLQVMDYARLTDNKGRHADFRNVVLIMTSNAGAQYATQANIGFSGNMSAGEAMMKQVKKTFKPEFINRLSGTVVFNDMDRTMASLILDKKLRKLRELLAMRKVEMVLSDAAREHLLRYGFTREYGAREIDRVIASQLKPLLMRAILFGRLKKGGTAVVKVKDGGLILE